MPDKSPLVAAVLVHSLLVTGELAYALEPIIREKKAVEPVS